MSGVKHCCLAAVLLCAAGAAAQNMMNDVLAGKLVKPDVGVYAVYQLNDAKGGQRLLLRQAIVGKERVRLKTAWWLETELRPQVGFPMVYKMLLTGPSSDPANVLRIVTKNSLNQVQILKPEQLPSAAPKETPRESKGKEKVATPQGEVEAEHFVIKGDEAAGDMEIWINEDIPPMGIVKMTSPEGELLLQRFGKDGKDAETAIPDELTDQAKKTKKKRGAK